jgi:heat shock transcription factor, other eukaryote
MNRSVKTFNIQLQGFRKVMSDRWEFANDKFRRGEEGLLSEIQRRRRPCDLSGPAGPLPPLPPPSRPATTSATSNSPDTLSSSSTSPQSPHALKLTDLTNENTKLRLEKQILSMEIAHTKKMCEDLLASLSKYVNTKDMNVQLLMKEGSMDSLEHILNSQTVPNAVVGEVKERPIKLFGTLLKVSAQNECMKERKRKWGWGENAGDMHSSGERPMKIAPWIPGSTSFQQGSSKVSN